ncbi:hypothetical protein KKG52_01060 [Patescibacteria group bacterium]|nr:hypothetical protein [Patescibacteria group bacterium]
MPDIFIEKDKLSEVKESPVEEVPELNKRNTISSNIPGEAGTFTSFAQNTRNVHFEEQDSDEDVLLFTRAHFAVNLKWILWIVLFSLIPPIFIVLNTFSPFFNIPFLYGIAFLSLFYLSLLLIFFIAFITWFYNISLVTNKRIIDVDFSDLIYHDVAATKLSQIEDIDYEQIGILRSFLNYGDLFLQTAGEKAHFDFLGIPTPRKASTIIHELIGRRRNNA